MSCPPHFYGLTGLRNRRSWREGCREREGRREGKDTKRSERNRPHNTEMEKRHEGIRKPTTTRRVGRER